METRYALLATVLDCRDGRASASIGGDHSVCFPLIAALERYPPLTTVLFDANRERLLSLKHTNNSPLRRARGRNSKPP